MEKRLLVDFYRSMVIAVTIVLVMKMARHQIVGVISMGDWIMTTRRPMFVFTFMGRTSVIRCALVAVRIVHGKTVLVDMISMGMMKMTIMEIVFVVVMLDCCMPTVGPVSMSMFAVCVTTHQYLLYATTNSECL